MKADTDTTAQRPNQRPELAAIDDETMRGVLRKMHLIRKFEEAAEASYMRGLIHGTMHLSIGQEASAVGSTLPLKAEDYILSTHRGHGHCIAKGADPARMFAEFFGKENGYCKGRGGSMHIADVEGGNLGANGIVGGGLPIAVGVGMSIKAQKLDRVAVVFFGDGASNEGAFHEALNMASIWKLPILFVCENNKYGMGTSIHRAAANPEFYTRGDYVPGIQVDGMDVLHVKKGFEFAAKWCRDGNGPIFLEAVTYRFHGHSMSDPGIAYRSKEEVDKMRREADPILVLQKRLLDQGWATEEDFKAMEKEARALVDKDVEFAKSSPQPSPDELCTDVYTGVPPPLIRMPDYEASWRYNEAGQRIA